MNCGGNYWSLAWVTSFLGNQRAGKVTSSQVSAWQVCTECKSRNLASLRDTWQLVHVLVWIFFVLLAGFVLWCVWYFHLSCIFFSCEGCTFANIGCYSLGRICSNLHGAYSAKYTVAGNLPFNQSGEVIENTVYLCDWTNHFIVWAIFYFAVVRNFIWRAKCSLGLPHWNNILPWLSKTVTLSSFISGLCLGWLRRRSSQVIYGCWITCWYCGFDLTCMGASGCL